MGEGERAYKGGQGRSGAVRCWRKRRHDICIDTVRWAQRRRNSPEAGHGSLRMSKLLAVLGATVGGTLGWWLGARVGLMTAFLASIVGTALGVYIGRRIARDYLE